MPFPKKNKVYQPALRPLSEGGLILLAQTVPPAGTNARDFEVPELPPGGRFLHVSEINLRFGAGLPQISSLPCRIFLLYYIFVNVGRYADPSDVKGGAIL